MEPVLKCRITGNPCGTDTEIEGCPCLCPACQQWLLEQQKESPQRKIQNKPLIILDKLHKSGVCINLMG